MRAAALSLQVGAVLVAVALIRRQAVGFDAFATPKELACSASVWLAASLCLPAVSRPALGREAKLLILVVLVSAVSLAVSAVNGWFAWRAFSASATAVVGFLCARRLSSRGFRHQVLAAAMLLVTTAAAGVVLEAFGLLPGFSMPGRAPGGFAGNRNFAAHLVAAGFPLLAMCTLRARTLLRRLLAAAAVVLAVLAIVLTRCRGAWLALLVVIGFSLCLAVARPLRKLATGRAAATLGLAMALGLMLGTIPTFSLVWVKPGVFESTLPRILEYDGGTGKGRLIQYRNTLRMIADHAILGVGPGNWSLRYPTYATPGDPSIGPGAIPVQRLPNSDWLGFAAERGVPALALLVCVFVLMVRRATRALRHAAHCNDPESGLEAWALLGTLGALGVLGTVDAVLQRPEPSLFASLVAGALIGKEPDGEGGQAAGLGLRWQRAAWLGSGAWIVAVIAGRLLASSWSFSPSVSRRELAFRLDPGNFTLATRLSTDFARRGQCERADQYAERAQRLNPFSPVRSRLTRYCEEIR